VTWTAALVVALTLAACVIGFGTAVLLTREDVSKSPPISASISGSGSSAQKGAMDAWRAEFHRIHPGLRINYEANGSGAGIRDFIDGKTAFAGSDVPMRPGERALADKRCGNRAVHLPMVVGPIALVYNLPTVPDLKLSPITVAGIFSGRINRWDDPKIAADNRGGLLPHTEISLFHRSDSSGTTHNVTSYLKAAGHWPHAPSTTWTGAGEGVAGSVGITHAVKYTAGSIGYVEYGFASNSHLLTAKVRNAAGQFVAPSPDSATKAMEGARSVGGDDDLVVAFDYLTKGKGVYPIVLVTYEIACSRNSDPLVRAFLNYTAGDAGQSYLPLYGYAPLPQGLLAKVRHSLGVTS
jgi:phosphate transport system substrate-binding protein